VIAMLVVVAVTWALQAVTATPASGPAALVGEEFTHTVKRGESLTLIGARFGIAAAALARHNSRSLTAVLHPGDILRVDNRHLVPTHGGEDLLINIPQRLLFVMDAGGAVRAHYPAGLGRRDWPTPVGEFRITEVEKNPTWDVPRSIQEEMKREGKPVIQSMPPCPENPLGRYWLRLSLGSLGIHGTNAPASVYTFQTHGCIRLHPDDVERLVTLVETGARGRLIYEPVLVGRVADGRVFAEVHPDVYGRSPGPMPTLRQLAGALALGDTIDWDRAARVAAGAEGIATDVTAGGGLESAF
jgi:L,D-transpeptidase ErfK/SrfK